MVESILKYINWVDIVIVILLLRGAYAGYRGGFGREIGRLISIVVGIIVSFQNYRLLGNLISSHSFVPSLYSNIISFILLLVIVVLVVKLLMAVIRQLMRVEFVPAVESNGGLIFGLIQGVIIASLVLVILVWLPFARLKKAITKDSYLGPIVLEISPAIHDSLIKFFSEKDIPTARESLELEINNTNINNTN